VSLPFALRGRTLELHICRHAIEARVVEGHAPISLGVAGPGGSRQTISAHPGRAYATKREQNGFSAWEEISG
jgi:kojibiose phosphorylase